MHENHDILLEFHAVTEHRMHLSHASPMYAHRTARPRLHIRRIPSMPTAGAGYDDAPPCPKCTLLLRACGVAHYDQQAVLDAPAVHLLSTAQWSAILCQDGRR